MTVLGTMLTRIAAIIRGVAAGYVLVQVVIWHAFYQADPARLWGPARGGLGPSPRSVPARHRFPPWPLVCLDWAVYAVLALAAGGCVPLAIRGQAGEWLFVTVASGLMVQVWFARRGCPCRCRWPPGLASGRASRWPRPAPPRGARAASVALLFVVVAVHWSAGGCCTAGPAGPTARSPRPTRTPGTSTSSCPETIERREQDRLLHDTVLNTLTAIARSGRRRGAISRCRQDMALLERALSEPADRGPGGRRPAAGRRPRGGRQRDARPGADRAAGHRRRRRGGARRRGLVPVPVAAAIAHATREALANVAAHAGTGEAWVTVSRRRPLSPARPGGPGDGAGRGRRVRPGPGRARPGWASGGPSPSGSPTAAARRRCGPLRARAPWCACAGPPARSVPRGRRPASGAGPCDRVSRGAEPGRTGLVQPGRDGRRGGRRRAPSRPRRVRRGARGRPAGRPARPGAGHLTTTGTRLVAGGGVAGHAAGRGLAAAAGARRRPEPAGRRWPRSRSRWPR